MSPEEFQSAAHEHGRVISKAEDIGVDSGIVHRRVVGRAWKKFLRDHATTEELVKLAKDRFHEGYGEMMDELLEERRCGSV